MKPTSSAWVCLVVAILCSIRAGFLYRSSTSELRSSLPKPPLSNRHHPHHLSPVESRSLQKDSTVIGADPEGLFYFVQISDLHLSKFRAKGHTLHFLHFLKSVLPVVNPSFVVVTGDLTDAKDIKRITSQQYPEEWQVYRSAVEQSNSSVEWYDMRGNHDCFDLPSWESRVNLYRTFGISASRVEEGQGIYSWQVKKPFGQYQFVAVDACPKRGPSRPLNFFGYLTSKTMDRLANALLPVQYNHTFVFSHYPTTTMVFGVSSQGHTFRDLARHYSVYLCGHLHRLIAGLGDVLQSYDPTTQSLELELGDMKEHGTYRIMAVDHDMISFVDTDLPLSQLPPPSKPITPLTSGGNIIWPEKVRTPPVVLITNPKDARFAIQAKEPLQRIRQSSHIRILVFSDAAPESMRTRVSIDGQPLPDARYVGKPGSAPLWVVEWDPSLYDNRKAHTLLVQATTSDNITGHSRIVFRVDMARSQIGGGAGEWIISTHMSTVLQCMTLLTAFAILVSLLIPQFYHRHYAQRLSTPELSNHRPSRSTSILLKIHAMDQHASAPASCQRRFSRAVQRQIYVWALRFLQLPKEQPAVWYATFAFVLGLLTLPWFRAEFIPSGATADERNGLFYMWGMVFGQEWVPIADTWLFAANQVCLDVGIFFLLFVWRTTSSAQLHCRGSTKASTTPHTRWHKQLNEHAWFKGLEVLFWLWRASELVALASFYGGVWPTLVQNMLVPWMVFVGGMLGWGRQGVFSAAKPSDDWVEACEACAQHQVRPLKSELTLSPLTTMTEKLAISSDEDRYHHVSMPEDEYRSSSSSGNSSSAASTPFNRSPRVKSRSRAKSKRSST